MPWWLFLITGIAWLLLSLIVLRFNLTSVASVGFLLGAILCVAGVNEFFVASALEGWKWLHSLLGVLFVIGGVWAFVHPIGAFYELASILGLLLVIKGTFDIIGGVMSKDVNELWWLGVTVGILELLLAFWASQQYFPARATLILIWVGLAAMFRGITEIVLAFGIRKAGKVAAA
jgi:uncharacterized membrane protein HdeD (DUF308 family)